MSIRRSLIWSASQQFNLYILLFVNMIITARLLSPAEVGIFVVALSVNMMLQAMREMGVSHYLIREADLSASKISTTFMISLLFAFTLGMIVFLLRHTIAGIFDEPEVARVLTIVVITIWIFPFEHPAQALLRREMRFKVMHHLSVSSKLISVIVTVILALNGFSFMALAYGMLTEAVLRATLTMLVENRHLRQLPSLTHWREVLSFGGWTTGASLANTVAVEGEKVISGAVLGVGATGLYDRAARLPQLLRQALVMTVGQVFLSSFAIDVRAGRSIGSKVLAMCAATCGFMWPILLILSLIAHEFVMLLFGPKWIEAATLLPWLMAGQAMLAMLPQPDQILVPFGAVRRLLLVRLLQVAVTLSFVSVLAQFGLLPFVIGTFIGAIVIVSFNWIAVRQFVDLGIGAFARSHLKSAFVALFTAAPVAVWVASGTDKQLWLLAALFTVPVLWVVALRLSGHLLWHEGQRLVAPLRARLAK